MSQTFQAIIFIQLNYMAAEKVAGFISAPRMCVNISMKSAVLKPSDVRTLSFQTLRLAELHEVVTYQIQQMSAENKLKGNIAFNAKHLLFLQNTKDLLCGHSGPNVFLHFRYQQKPAGLS